MIDIRTIDRQKLIEFLRDNYQHEVGEFDGMLPKGILYIIPENERNHALRNFSKFIISQ